MMRVCNKCGERFRKWETPEEWLLQAIFGVGPLCKKCAREHDAELQCLCSACTNRIDRDKEVFFNDKPYHSYCLPYSN